MPHGNHTHQTEDRSSTPNPARDQQIQKGTRLSMPLILQRAYADPSSLTVTDVKHLQRTIGNRAVIGLLSKSTGLQAKLKLGPAGDQYEQEADHVAQQVVRQMAHPQPVQRQPLEEEELQMKPSAGTISPLQRNDEPRPKMVFTKPGEGTIRQPKPPAATISRVQRTPKLTFTKSLFAQRQEEEDELQMKPLHGPEGGAVEQSVEKQIQAARGGGKALDDNLRGSMEKGFGADFSNVRVHTGGQADKLNRSLNARAFTVGSDVFFKRGEYNPGSSGGKQLLAHELTHTVQQGAASVQRHVDEEHLQMNRYPGASLRLTDPRVSKIQRLIDRPGMIALAGTPSKNIGLGALKYRRGTEYKQVLTLLDQYHQQSQQLWTQNANAQNFRTTLHPILDNLTQAAWSYLAVQEDSPRAPHIKDLVYRQIPEERERVNRLAERASFDTLDRTRPVNETKDAKPVQITGIGIEAGETQVVDQAEGGMADCHSMAVWAEIDAGNQPAQPDSAPPNSIYGISLEYWENVEIPYHFTVPANTPPQTINQLKTQGEGATIKPWNDILSMQTDSPTWGKTGGPVTMSWVNAVTAANNNQLRGKHKIGFVDNPGVTPLPGKYIKRILRFRIVVKNGSSQREIYATQVIELDGKNKPVYKTYIDSVGNQLAVERTQVVNTQQEQMTPMAVNDPRVAGGHGIDANILAQSVPNAAQAEVRPFVASLLSNTAAAFQNDELNSVRTKFNMGPTQDASGPYKAYARMGKLKYNTASDYYEIAGMNGLPYPKPGQSFCQRPINGGGLLVAILEGGQIQQMYYTDNQARLVGAQQVGVRSFAQIPLEQVTPYVHEQKYLSSLSNTEQQAFDQVKQGAGVRQVAINTARQQIGQAIATDPGTLQYLRTHIKEYDLVEKAYNTAHSPQTLVNLLQTHFAGKFTNHGTTLQQYKQLQQEFRHEKAWAVLNETYVSVVKLGGVNDPNARTQLNTLINTNRAALGSGPALISIAQQHGNNPVNFKRAIMLNIEHNKDKTVTFENDYNTLIPPLNLANISATLGELVNAFFEDEFTQHGDGVDVFAGLMNKYSAFQYRIKPIYRNLFGDGKLRKVTEQMQKAEIAAEVPEPGSPANLAAKQAFFDNGVFTIPDFGSSIEPAAKFDASYDPKSGQLRIVVKLSFEFRDDSTPGTGTTRLGKVKGKEVGKQYGKNAWTPQSQNQFIEDFKRNVLNIWNPGARTIRCVRPGWEDVMAQPVFEIQQVTKGSGQHNNVIATKAILEEKQIANQKQKNLKAQGVSAWGKVDTGLKEFDVADKLSDPSVHRYLHQPERTGNIAPAYQTDRTRLENRMQQFGKIAFQNGSGTAFQDPGRLPILLGELNRLLIPADLSHLHPLIVSGGMNGGINAGLTDQRANTVIQALQNAGIQNLITKGPALQNFDGAVVTAAPADPNIVDTYVKKWSRISAAHEFGHMLGLMDEYYGAKSDAVVRKMISDGLLPPDTRGDHLKANPPTTNESEAKGQAATMELLEKTGLETPDFTLQDNAKSSSLMTGGYELWSQHFVTVWEALTTLTSAHLDSKYWKLG